MKSKYFPKTKSNSLIKNVNENYHNGKDLHIQLRTEGKFYKKLSKPKSQKKQSKQQSFTNVSSYLKEHNIIPTPKQASQKQKESKQFQRRTFYKKHKHLQNLFKQNCRIYQHINRQTSFYIFQNQEETNSVLGRRSHSKKKRTNSVDIASTIKQKIRQSISMNRKSIYGKSFINQHSPQNQKFKQRYSIRVPKQKMNPNQHNMSQFNQNQQFQYNSQKNIYNLLNQSRLKNFTTINYHRKKHRKNKTEFNLNINKQEEDKTKQNNYITSNTPKQLMLKQKDQPMFINSSTFIRTGFHPKCKKNSTIVRC